jgi:hypothetical protein
MFGLRPAGDGFAASAARPPGLLHATLKSAQTKRIIIPAHGHAFRASKSPLQAAI